MIADEAIAWADKIDARLGPIPGADADKLAHFLRRVATELSGIKHPTGSEEFAAGLASLGVPAPWELSDGVPGELLADNKAVACQSLDSLGAEYGKIASAALIMIAVNTLAGFKAVQS
jgi:hypothetical protein